jgi:hypothetical protein
MFGPQSTPFREELIHVDERRFHDLDHYARSLDFHSRDHGNRRGPSRHAEHRHDLAR